MIEVNPRSSRTVPFLSKATGVPMADIATRVILGHSLREQGITEVYGRERSRWFVKAPAFSFAKIRGMESYLSPEMKSTGEAIGYDNKLTRALYKALQSSGMTVANYGTIFLTIADKDKQDALPLVRRFYDLGFNIEATKGTAEIPASAWYSHPYAPQVERRQYGDHRLAAPGPCELCHQYDRHQPAQHPAGWLRDFAARPSRTT